MADDAPALMTASTLRHSELLPAELIADEDDDFSWETRCKMWASRTARQRANGHKRTRHPLVITGHGASLRIEHGSLVVKGGFTHYPQTQESHRFFKGQPGLPDRIVLLDASGSLSFDVLSWLAEQDISLIRTDWRGDIVCIASKSGYSANPYRVQWQRETRADEAKRLDFSSAQIHQKIQNSISVLEKAIPATEARRSAIGKAYETLDAIERRLPHSVGELRVLEANAAASYFRAWKGIPIKWRGITRRPVPEDWHQIQQRTSAHHRAGSRNAHHPVNALLNYSYTLLQSQIQIAAIAEGYDPTIGVMHEKTDGSASFVFDLMEPKRPKSDILMLDFLSTHVFDPADFLIRSDGICRINPELARNVASSVLQQFHWSLS